MQFLINARAPPPCSAVRIRLLPEGAVHRVYRTSRGALDNQQLLLVHRHQPAPRHIISHMTLASVLSGHLTGYLTNST